MIVVQTIGLCFLAGVVSILGVAALVLLAAAFFAPWLILAKLCGWSEWRDPKWPGPR